MNRREFLALTALAGLGGCRASSRRGLSHWRSWGKHGLRDGEFVRPRAMGTHRGEIYVIDTIGRIQVFTPAGEFLRLWTTPEADNGTPTAIAFDGDTVLVPDTHYSQILEYTVEGELIERWGRYGLGPGEFIYPTGIAKAGGLYFVCEYGEGAQRVRVFDAERGDLRQWGQMGHEPGQFNRAMAIGVDEDGVVYVADMSNHRIECFSAEGEHLRSVGAPGSGPGDLKYPYSFSLGPSASLFVAEYGNHRVSQFRTDGQFVRSYGSAGRELWQFNAPRGLAVAPGGEVFVADTDNHRIQVFPAEGLA